MRKRYFLYLVLLGGILAACKKNEPEYGMTTLKHFENDSLYSYVQIPNAFTPDGDGINDLFTLFSSGLDETRFELTISNKSGQKVFVTANLQIGWDGTHKGSKASSGKYYYQLTAADKTGYEYHHKGSVYLMR